MDDLNRESPFAQLARKHWLGAAKKVQVKQDVLKKQIWDTLEKEDFASSSLVLLENLQIVEKYLWPGYTDDASNFHVLLLAILITVKRREHLPSWELLADRPSDFSSFFRRLLSISVDTSLRPRIRTHVLVALVGAFQSLDSGLLRKECAPLVSISIWHNLHDESVRERRLQSSAQTKKAWRASIKRYDAADDATKSRLSFERSWLFSLVMDFLDILYDTTRHDGDNVIYCERFVEFLTDLQSQFPTRRYVNTLLQDLNVGTAIKLSPMYNEASGLMVDLYALFQHFQVFPLDDQTGEQRSMAEANKLQFDRLAQLQRIALKHFKNKLTLLALSNYGSLDRRSELEAHLQPLSDEELRSLCVHLGYRVAYSDSSKVVIDRPFLLEVLLSAHEKLPNYQETVKNMSVLPTDTSLYEQSLLRNESYSGSRPLAIPKLNLQYLSTGDFLWRSFILYRCESFYEIRKDMEDTIKRLQPRLSGSSRMALRISKPAIIEVLPPKVGEKSPAHVRAEIILDVSRLHDNVRKEWESLRPDDVIFLLVVAPNDDSKAINGNSTSTSPQKSFQTLRAAQIVQVLDGNGRALRARSDQPNGYHSRPRQRRLLVNIDPIAYQQDAAAKDKGKPDVYDSINLIIRRRGRENNFRSVLETIKGLTLSGTNAALPAWLQDVFLGLGDPAGATYKRLPNALKSLDYRDTFLDFEHLADSLPGRTLERADGKIETPLEPPFVLETSESTKEDSMESSRPSKKRRRDEDNIERAAEAITVSTYRPVSHGPYPSDAPKLNKVRYTPTQVDAITSGTQPGLTIIVGPPGTGKTDVATQIINNIYHNFPEERTLLVAHSNQALNQLFQKITALDIDQRHLLRLGHGEEELRLDTDASFSKHGRVESLLENGSALLLEVRRLAATMEAPGAHGSTCETAGYFNSVYVQPAWTQYCTGFLDDPESAVQQIVEAFPFHAYFSNAPQPLFAPEVSKEDAQEIAHGCYRHISKIFSELADIRPFEVLRNDRTKANYLLVKEARIIAMTSTHAGIRRDEIAKLGFHYDNVVMEEAAQVTEIENFIPLALQNSKDGKSLPLKRVVLCGDHLQNSPIVQNLAFRQYANMEQSLFLRLVRLGVPTIMLDQQGRARASLAELYKFRYPHLGNLPNTMTATEFLHANAGFRYDYQFVDVPDYKERGEMEPTPHFKQNLGEAEYAVAIFMYMRLLGYPASKISILTTYAGQRALIKDVISHRCAKNRLFGLPRIVTTVDKYQGEQNDYIILSLVRTNRPGYLRDIRRLTVALSRARLGLYVLGRREVFEACLELQDAFALFWQRPNKLSLVTGEMFPTTRLVDAEIEPVTMEGVEHLGKYVFEMTQAKIKDLKGGVAALPAVEEGVVDEDEDDAVVEEEVDEAMLEAEEDEDPDAVE